MPELTNAPKASEAQHLANSITYGKCWNVGKLPLDMNLAWNLLFRPQSRNCSEFHATFRHAIKSETNLAIDEDWAPYHAMDPQGRRHHHPSRNHAYLARANATWSRWCHRPCRAKAHLVWVSLSSCRFLPPAVGRMHLATSCCFMLATCYILSKSVIILL